MKICVYTCITGNYDKIKKFYPQNSDIDFICFTDNPNLKYQDTNWSFRYIPDDLLTLSKVKQQRLIKILPHKYLPEYDISLWVDGNINIISDLKDIFSTYDFEKNFLYVRKHPCRNCIYEEANAIWKYRKDSYVNIFSQVESYKNEGFPKNFGLIESGIILRSHNNVKCKIFCNLWANEIIKGSHRDQLSFDYCRWKTGYNIGYLDIKLSKNKYFRLQNHG